MLSHTLLVALAALTSLCGASMPGLVPKQIFSGVATAGYIIEAGLQPFYGYVNCILTNIMFHLTARSAVRNSVCSPTPLSLVKQHRLLSSNQSLALSCLQH